MPRRRCHCSSERLAAKRLTRRSSPVNTSSTPPLPPLPPLRPRAPNAAAVMSVAGTPCDVVLNEPFLSSHHYIFGKQMLDSCQTGVRQMSGRCLTCVMCVAGSPREVLLTMPFLEQVHHKILTDVCQTGV